MDYDHYPPHVKALCWIGMIAFSLSGWWLLLSRLGVL